MPSLWSRLKVVMRSPVDPRLVEVTNRELAEAARFQSALQAHKLTALPLDRLITSADQRARSANILSPEEVKQQATPLLEEAFAQARQRGMRSFKDRRVPTSVERVLAKEGRVTDKAALAELFRWPTAVRRQEIRDKETVQKDRNEAAAQVKAAGEEAAQAVAQASSVHVRKKLHG